MISYLLELVINSLFSYVGTLLSDIGLALYKHMK